MRTSLLLGLLLTCVVPAEVEARPDRDSSFSYHCAQEVYRNSKGYLHNVYQQGKTQAYCSCLKVESKEQPIQSAINSCSLRVAPAPSAEALVQSLENQLRERKTNFLRECQQTVYLMRAEEAFSTIQKRVAACSCLYNKEAAGRPMNQQTIQECSV